MADRPDHFPEWAVDDEIDDVSGQNNVVEPPEERKASGWTRREIPPRQWQNWLSRFVWQWLAWARDKIDDIGPRVDTNETDISDLDGRVDTNETDISDLDGRVDTNETDIDSVESELNAATNEPTPDTLAKRDADGRMRAEGPVDLKDVVNLGFVADPDNYDLSQNGYYRFPGGLIMQWGFNTQHTGNHSGGTLNGTVSFPLADGFPTAIFSVTATLEDANRADVICTTNTLTKTGFKFKLQEFESSNQDMKGVRWFAIGY
jgi:hypothetical protein